MRPVMPDAPDTPVVLRFKSPLEPEIIAPLTRALIRGTDSDGPDWRDDALCAESDPEIFFPEPGGSVRGPKSVCARCEVRAECLAYALEHDEKFGVWGGMTERERWHLKRQVAA